MTPEDKDVKKLDNAQNPGSMSENNIPQDDQPLICPLCGSYHYDSKGTNISSMCLYSHDCEKTTHDMDEKSGKVASVVHNSNAACDNSEITIIKPDICSMFKFHSTVEKDYSDGEQSNIHSQGSNSSQHSRLEDGKDDSNFARNGHSDQLEDRVGVGDSLVDEPAQIDQTSSRMVDETAQVDQTSSRMVDEPAQIDQTSSRMVDELVQREETYSRIVGELAQVDKPSSIMVNEPAQIDETSSRMFDELAQVDLTSSRMVDELAQVDQTSSRMVDEHAQIDETSKMVDELAQIDKTSSRMVDELAQTEETSRMVDEPAQVDQTSSRMVDELADHNNAVIHRSSELRGYHAPSVSSELLEKQVVTCSVEGRPDLSNDCRPGLLMEQPSSVNIETTTLEKLVDISVCQKHSVVNIPACLDDSVDIPVCQKHPVDIPLCQKQSVDIPPCQKQSVDIPLCQKPPIDIPPCQKHPVDIPPCQKPPVCLEDPADIHSSSEDPVDISACLEDPVEDPVGIPVCLENPVDDMPACLIDATEDSVGLHSSSVDPVDIPPCLEDPVEDPVGMPACRQDPISILACQEHPVDMPVCLDDCVSIPASLKDPVGIPASLKDPVGIPASLKDPVGIATCQKDPVDVLSSEDPIDIPASLDAAADTDALQDTNIIPAVCVDAAPLRAKKKKKKKKLKLERHLEIPCSDDQKKYYASSFTELLPSPEDEFHSDFTCPVCLELYHRPHVITPCQHMFCEPCLRKLPPSVSADNAVCPLCRHSIQTCVLDLDLHVQLSAYYAQIYEHRARLEKRLKTNQNPLPRMSAIPLSQRLIRRILGNGQSQRSSSRIFRNIQSQRSSSSRIFRNSQSQRSSSSRIFRNSQSQRSNIPWSNVAHVCLTVCLSGSLSVLFAWLNIPVEIGVGSLRSAAVSNIWVQTVGLFILLCWFFSMFLKTFTLDRG